MLHAEYKTKDPQLYLLKKFICLAKGLGMNKIINLMQLGAYAKLQKIIGYN